MSANTETTLDPAAQHQASAEPRLAQQETELATHPKDVQSGATTDSTAESTTDSSILATYTESASNAAAAMKDNMFSMFGGGTKKEKKPEPEDDVDEPSGSSKAKKDAEDAEVRMIL